MKQSKYKSKMGDLVYSSLTMQDYLVECEVNLAKIILSYRLSMSKFWGNFKGKEKIKMCPLCDSHEDLQCLSFQCPVIIEKVNPRYKYETIFLSVIPVSLAETLEKIDKVRGEILSEK